MTSLAHILFGALSLMPFAAQAMDIKLPSGAKLTSEITNASDSYQVPISGWDGSGIQSVAAEGHIAKQVWRLDGSSLTTLEMLNGFREQLTSLGYTTIFECETEGCGGFDFRFAADILPEPEMHVDLGDFRTLSASRKSGEATEYLNFVVSKSANAGFVQIVQTGGNLSVSHPLTTSTKGTRPSTPIAPSSLSEQLEAVGHFVLEDLEFATGSSNLANDSFATLAALADYLKSNPQRTVALVGHTDAEGSLAGNVALSKKRARAVADVLVQDYSVAEQQLAAEGMGFLSPRASNLTDEGRSHNRRVEVILTSTE